MTAAQTLHWPAEAIWEAVAPALPDFTVEVLPELDSTNTELMRRARAGRIEPVLLVAQEQTAGRGRLGRGWASAAGDSLTFSIGLPLAPADWSGLSLAVGVAAAQALHDRISLKWPNDLWLDGRKLGGILCETASFAGAAPGTRYLVAGLGLNIAPQAAQAAQGLVTPPAALRELWPQADAGAALLKVAPAVVQALLRFAREGFAPFHAAFAVRDLLKGQALVLSDGTAGTGAGVDAQGGLLVRTPTGLRTITSAEVSVRPAGGSGAA